MRRSLAITTLVSLVLLLFGCGGGGGTGTASSPAAGVYVGFIHDSDGNPVEGARVSIDGIEAKDLTGPDGSYKVNDRSLARPSSGMAVGAVGEPATVEIAVLAPGLLPQVSSLEVSEGVYANVDLVRSGLEPELTLTSPPDSKPLVVPSSCGNPEVVVEGFAKLEALDNYRLDVLLILDRSGSAAEEAFDLDGDGLLETVLDAELDAADCFVEGLDPRVTRVSVMTFNDSTRPAIDFTSDLEAVKASLATVGAPSGGTNFEAAFLAARDAFLALEAADAAALEAEAAGNPVPVIPAPFRAVIFLSDGIATSHGVPRDTTDSNLTQGSADRAAAIEAAKSLGAMTSAQLFAYSFIPLNDKNRQRTTLPHCVAACGGGKYESIEDVSLLSSTLCGEALESLVRLEIANVTLGSPAVLAQLRADGSFSQPVSVALGPESLVGVADAEGFVANVIEVTLTAFPGAYEKVVVQSLEVRLMSEESYVALGAEAILHAHAAPKPVAELSALLGPLGRPLGDDELRQLLVGAEKAEFEDAVELPGVEDFKVSAPAQEMVTVVVDFLYKEACNKSDLGYLIIDPANPPASPEEALAGVTESNILLNTGDLGSPNCSAQVIAPGDGSFSFSVPSGAFIVFFIFPNSSLPQYRGHPLGKNGPLFTMSSLNPGGFDQVLTFRSIAGRTEPGASTAVVTPGPTMIFGFEDLSIASKKSDQDFTDLVFMVRNASVEHMEQTSCAD